jgi:glycosyltransferase involved in cell wall biosynthesis
VLLDAFARVAAEVPDVDLVLTGGAGADEEAVASAVAALGDRVLRLGRIPRAELDAVLAAAEALVFPSAFEGFGLPVLEAMAAGVPVLCSDLPVLRELTGGAAVLVPPGDAAAWAAAIRDRLADPRRREELAAPGLVAAARYTPERSAAALEAAYRAALSRVL